MDSPQAVTHKMDISHLFSEARVGRLGPAGLAKAAVDHADLFTRRDNAGATLLHWLSLRGDIACVNACLAFGADVRGRSHRAPPPPPPPPLLPSFLPSLPRRAPLPPSPSPPSPFPL
jgi:ankyrin repeat protein